jgi:multidrug efflux pump subunit AcrA (membrane-fusion protein)
MKTNLTKAKRTNFWKKKTSWLGIILLMVIGGGTIWYFGLGGSTLTKATTQQGPDYYTSPVRRGDLRISASGSGKLVAKQTYDLNFLNQGVVEALNVKTGEQVKAGQVLARQGNTETLQANLANAQLNALQAQKTLKDLQQNANLTLAQAYQDWVKAKENYNNALTGDQRTAYARCSKEVNTKYAAALDKAKQKLEDLTLRAYGSDDWINAKNVYDNAAANYNYCQAYTSVETTNAGANLQIAKIAMQQAEEKYNTLKDASGIDPNDLTLAETKVNETNLKLAQAQKELEGVSLTSPIDGTVIYLAANQGAQVGTAKFITIADISQAIVQVSLDETDLDKLVLNAKAQIVFDALPEQTLTGKVIHVEPQLVTQGQSQIAQGLIELDSNGQQAVKNLPLGLNASVEIITQETTNALLVPNEALRDLGNKEYAVFIKQNNQLVLKNVKVGLSSSTFTEITSGIKEGDLVSTGKAQVSK